MITTVFIDIDNTLAPYEQPTPDDRIRAWFDALREAGIKASLVSNNHAPRVEKFNETLGLPAYPDSGKPGRKMLEYAMEQMGVAHGECAMLGDQLLTAESGHDRHDQDHIYLREVRVEHFNGGRGRNCDCTAYFFGTDIAKNL